MDVRSNNNNFKSAKWDNEEYGKSLAQMLLSHEDDEPEVEI